MSQEEQLKEKVVEELVRLLKEEKGDYDQLMGAISRLRSEKDALTEEDFRAEEKHLMMLLKLLEQHELEKLKEIKTLYGDEAYIERIRDRYFSVKKELLRLYKEIFGYLDHPDNKVPSIGCGITHIPYNNYLLGRSHDSDIRIQILAGKINLGSNNLYSGMKQLEYFTYPH